MKTLLHFTIALIVGVLLSFNSNAQFTDYDRDTKWNIGLNMGGVWQDGDIQLDRPGFGYGFTIGKGIYEAPSKFWSVDLRFRYLKGRTFGQNTFRTDSSELAERSVFATNPSNYKNTLGFTYLNTETAIHDFSLEAVINFHALREKTGVLLSVFGGVGITDYRTKTNLLDGNNSDKIYNYLNVDTNNISKSTFRSLQDDDYESFAPFSEKKNVKIMPSLGIGLGYQFTPQWSIGFEHRVTFTLQDKFDGQEKAGTQFLQWGDNDKYHYSSIFLRLNIFRGKESTSRPTRDCPPPYLKIDLPEVFEVNEDRLFVRARVSKIETNNDVMLVVNDQIEQTTYTRNTDYVSGTIALIEGENKIYFIATNTCGESIDSALIIYNPDFCPKAVISFIEPIADSVNSKELILKARVLRLQGGILEVKVNNQVIQHQFDSNALLLTANASLNLGTNTISIKATNKCGDTTVFKQITYFCFPPTVTISSPQNGAQLKTATALLNAVSKNIDNKDQVSVTFNGVNLPINFSKSTQKITGNLNPKEGTNVLSVTVTNDCGTDTKTISFNYEEPCLLPAVSISAPANNSNVTNSVVNFRGTITNITNASSIVLRVNGVRLTPSFNASNGQVSATINLQQGANSITLEGVNDCGRDNQTVTVTYNCPAPLVIISNPINGTSVTNQTITISGSVTNITSSNQIVLLVNGISTPVNVSAGRFSTLINLRDGQNTISASATTDCGRDIKSVVVNYNKPCPQPFVSITNPANGSTVSNSSVTLTGTATNINSQTDMSVSLNGTNQSFSWNSSNKVYVASLNLREGANTIIVNAATNCGNDSKTITINYNKACPAPAISITSPNNGSYVTTSVAVLTGTAFNINTQSEMSVKLNGVNQSFSWNSVSKVYTASLNLREGNNTVLVSASNNCGNDSKTITINYNKACPEPTATITSPRNGLNATVLSVPFTGIVTNIQNSSQVTLKLNGTVINKNVNTSTGLVTATLPIVSGGNTVELIVANNCGNASASVSVSYKCPLPTLNISSPLDGMSYTTSAISFEGFVSGVSAKSQVSIKLNGSTLAFTYDTRLSKFSGTANLTEGNNTLTASVTNQCGTVNKSVSVTYTKPCPKPTVVITTPSNGSSSTTGTVQITGIASNLNSQSDLQLKVNGVNTNFSYNSATKLFTATVTLKEGNNSIVATVATNCGNDSKSVSVTYTKPCPKPTVVITTPSNGSSSTAGTVQITGIASNLNSQSDLELKVNGVNTNFSYNSATKLFTATATLKEGNNSIVATVATNCGNDSKSVSVTYTKPCPKPTVVITTPSNGISSTTGTVQITGIASNLNSQSDLELKVNGVNTNFSYNFSTKLFTATATLKEGNNTIVATVATNCGEDSKSVSLSYTKACPKPIVSISTPSNGSSVSKNTISISGSVSNIANKSDMQVKVNGSNVTFNYNASSKLFTATVSLKEGNNSVEVFAATNCGEDAKSVTVTYKKPCVSPSVNLSSPINGSVSSTGVATIKGIATNINSTNELIVMINGTKVTTNYSLSSKVFNASGNLKEGNNTIKATVKNDCGESSKTTTVVYTKPCPKPVVTILTPKNNAVIKTNTVLITGIVTNINNKTDMQLAVNGGIVAFNYNASTKAFSATVTLIPGQLNSIDIEVNTNCGSDFKSITISSAVTLKPIINVLSPSADTSTYPATQLKINGEVQKVTSKSQFSIKVNGVPYTGFTFTRKSAENFVFNGLITLNPGINVITFTAVHSSGGREIVTKIVDFNTGVNNINVKPNNGNGSKPNESNGISRPGMEPK